MSSLSADVSKEIACVAGGIGDRVRVLCLWRMAERGNRGAARELERAARELGRSRVEGISLAAAPLADRGFAAHARGLRPLLSQLDSSPIRSRLRGSLSPRTRASPAFISFRLLSNSLAAPSLCLSLPLAINKARALGRQSRQLRRLQRRKKTVAHRLSLSVVIKARKVYSNFRKFGSGIFLSSGMESSLILRSFSNKFHFPFIG